MDSLFFSYSHKDEVLRDQLETQLTMLKRQGVISAWHDRRLLAGDNVDEGINGQLENSDIILLLVSPDFLASEYCYGREMTRALERHKAGEARVIPVILRPCEWQHAPFGKLLAAPKDGRPVTKWADQDEAFLDITSAIRKAARNRDLRLPKAFTERDHERFAGDAYESMARFFESSLDELSAHRSGTGIAFKRIDATRFTASIGRYGVPLGRCVIRLGRLGSVHEITFTRGADANSTNCHERLVVEVYGEVLVLKATRDAKKTLNSEAAAEYYWGLFVALMSEQTTSSSACGLPGNPETANRPPSEDAAEEVDEKVESAAALYNLGIRHELGIGVPPDTARARECYIRAARKGERGAMNSLGLLYEQGEGVIAPNLEKARVWYRLGARHNSEEARENLKRFEN